MGLNNKERKASSKGPEVFRGNLFCCTLLMEDYVFGKVDPRIKTCKQACPSVFENRIAYSRDLPQARCS